MNNTTDYYFSDWKVVTLPLVFGHLLFILLPSLFLNTSILVVLITYKDLRSPLSLLYGFVLVLAICNSLVTGPVAYSSVIAEIKDCDCSINGVHQGLSTAIHNVLYPAVFAEISLFQLLVIKHGKKIASYKTVLIVISATVVLYAPIPLSLFGASYTQLCDRVCLGLDTTYNPTIVSMAYFVAQALVWVGPMAVILVCYIWVWVLYKKGALRENRNEEGHGISLKIATLPAVMPLVMHIQTLPFFLEGLIGAGVIMQFPTYWKQVTTISPYLLRDLSGLVYPIFLLYLSSKIRACWKKMLQVCSGTVLQLLIMGLLCCFSTCLKLPSNRPAQVAPAKSPGHAEQSVPTQITVQVRPSSLTTEFPGQSKTEPPSQP